MTRVTVWTEAQGPATYHFALGDVLEIRADDLPRLSVRRLSWWALKRRELERVRAQNERFIEHIERLEEGIMAAGGCIECGLIPPLGHRGTCSESLMREGLAS